MAHYERVFINMSAGPDLDACVQIQTKPLEPLGRASVREFISEKFFALLDPIPL